MDVEECIEGSGEGMDAWMNRGTSSEFAMLVGAQVAVSDKTSWPVPTWWSKVSVCAR